VLVAPCILNPLREVLAGLPESVPPVTVLGNAVDGGNCELFCRPGFNVIPSRTRSISMKPPAFRSLYDRVAHAHRTSRHPPGQTVLVCANSGRGHCAIQIAKMPRSLPQATHRKATRRRLGAISSSTTISRFRGSAKINYFEGVDIVIEHVGPATWQEASVPQD